MTNHRIRQVLAELSVCASAAAHNPQPSRGGKPESRPPPHTDDVVGHFVRRYLHCRTDTQRHQVIEAAETELASTRKQTTRPAPVPVRDLVLRHTGRNYRDVAREERVSESYVRKIRTEAGLSPLDGKPNPGPERVAAQNP